MDGYLKQSTASQTRWIGPFVDDTDFKTAETGLSIANTDIKISANGGSSASKNSGGGTHDVNGTYAVTWDATDTATVGQLKYTVKVAGALQVFGSYIVVEEAIYDALFAASANAFAGAAGSTTLTALAANSITAAVIATGAIDADAIADNAIDAGAIADNAITDAKVASDVTIASVTGAVGSVTGAVGSVTGNVGGNVTGSVGSVVGAVGSVTGAVASVTGNVGGNVVGTVGSVVGAVGSVTGAVGSVTGAVGSVTGSVGGNVTGSVGSVATGGIAAASFAAGAIDAAAIAADAIGASELAAGAVDEILDDTIGDGTITVRQALRVMVAALGGKLSGAATTTVTIRNAADTADVIIATVDANGNRTATTVTP